MADLVHGFAVADAVDEGSSAERSLTDGETETVHKLVRPLFVQKDGA